jgi:hypothetical protein
MWKNTIFTHNPTNAKGVSNYDIVEKLPVFFYTSSKGGTYKFTAYDLRNFLIKEYRSRTLSNRKQVIHVAESFTVTKKSTALVDDEKVYPPFCYKNHANMLS